MKKKNYNVSTYEWIPILGLFTGAYKMALFKSAFVMLIWFAYQSIPLLLIITSVLS